MAEPQPSCTLKFGDDHITDRALEDGHRSHNFGFFVPLYVMIHLLVALAAVLSGDAFEDTGSDADRVCRRPRYKDVVEATVVAVAIRTAVEGGGEGKGKIVWYR